MRTGGQVTSRQRSVAPGHRGDELLYALLGCRAGLGQLRRDGEIADGGRARPLRRLVLGRAHPTLPADLDEPGAVEPVERPAPAVHAKGEVRDRCRRLEERGAARPHAAVTGGVGGATARGLDGDGSVFAGDQCEPVARAQCDEDVVVGVRADLRGDGHLLAAVGAQAQDFSGLPLRRLGQPGGFRRPCGRQRPEDMGRAAVQVGHGAHVLPPWRRPLLAQRAPHEKPVLHTVAVEVGGDGKEAQLLLRHAEWRKASPGRVKQRSTSK